jgi:hypothetical protein
VTKQYLSETDLVAITATVKLSLLRELQKILFKVWRQTYTRRSRVSNEPSAAVQLQRTDSEFPVMASSDRTNGFWQGVLMDSIDTGFGNIYISETVHVERWSGKNERSWHVLNEGKPIAELTFTVNEGLIRVLHLSVDIENRSDEIVRDLILLLQARYPGQWLEVPQSSLGAVEGITTGKKSNEDRQLAEVILKKFDSRMKEAEAVYEHMKAYQWGFRGRMEFYGNFPDFLSREEIREKLVAQVDALPEHLIRVSHPAETMARSI